jgi:adenylate cyclase
MQAMSECVVKHKGVVNKYIGDAVMAVFGVPFPRHTEAGLASDARNAVACALEMWRTLDALNAKWTAEGKKTMRMRVGIFTGPLVAGCLGGTERLEYTVIGDTVNTANRLESAGKTIDLPQARERACVITIGQSTQRLLGDAVRVIPVGFVELKGKADKIQTFFVDGENNSKEPA